jgi:mannose-6-phosphate isomerase-like protein (cupin superfamily)
MLKATIALLGMTLALPAAVHAQMPLPATDITAADVQAFLKQLPPNAISDRPIRVVDVGGYKVGVYGVFRPKSVRQDAVLHETRVTEVYQMLEGAGTLVTGGTLMDADKGSVGGVGKTFRGSRIEGGVSRRVTKGDIIIIPAGTPHWWSQLEGDISYVIIRPDPEGRQTLK